MRIYGLLFLFTLLWSASTFAQASKPPEVPRGYEIVVIVAKDVEEDLRLTERSVIVIRAEDARRAGLKTVADVLRTYADVNIVTTGRMPGSLTSTFMRGGASSYTLVLLDNVPINQIGGFYDLGHLSLDNVERIEVLKGPGSTVYGSEAVTGVIRIITRRGWGRPGGSVYVSYGSFQTFEARAESSGEIGAGIFYSASLSRLTSRRQLPVNDDYRRWTASLQLGGSHADDRHRWALRYRFGDFDVHFPTTLGDRIDVAPDPRQFSRTREHTAGAEWTARWSQRWSSRIDVGFFRYFSRYEDPDDGFPVDGWGDYWSEFVDERWRVNTSVNYDGAAHHLILGTTYTVESGGNRSIWQQDWRRHTRWNWALYARETYRTLQDRLSLTTGLRWERHSDYADVVAPEVGIAFWITPHWKLRGAVGVGYKAPSFTQIHGIGRLAVGNPDLKPERSTGWDLGLEFWSPGNLQIRVTYFENRFRDIIQFVNRPEPEAPDFENLQAALARGVEFEATRTWGAWTVQARYTLTHTEATDTGGLKNPRFREGEPLLRRPRHRATVSVGYHTEGLQIWLNFLYQGSRWDLDWRNWFQPQRVKLSPYTRLDLRFQWRVGRGLALVGHVENLLNVDYQEVFGYTGQKRGVYLGLTLGQ